MQNNSHLAEKFYIRILKHLTRPWYRTHSFEDLENLRSATNHYHAAIIKDKRIYNSSLLSSSCTNPRQL